MTVNKSSVRWVFQNCTVPGLSKADLPGSEFVHVIEKEKKATEDALPLKKTRQNNRQNKGTFTGVTAHAQHVEKALQADENTTEYTVEKMQGRTNESRNCFRGACLLYQ